MIPHRTQSTCPGGNRLCGCKLQCITHDATLQSPNSGLYQSGTELFFYIFEGILYLFCGDKCVARAGYDLIKCLLLLASRRCSCCHLSQKHCIRSLWFLEVSSWIFRHKHYQLYSGDLMLLQNYIQCLNNNKTTNQKNNTRRINVFGRLVSSTMRMKMNSKESDWSWEGWNMNIRKLSYSCTSLIQVSSGRDQMKAHS